MIEVKEKELATQTVASIRATTTFAEIGKTLGEILPVLWQTLQTAGVSPLGPPFTLYDPMPPDMDMETPFGLEGAFLVPEGTMLSDERVKISILPAGHVLEATHIGHYDELHKTYSELDQYLKAKNLILRDRIRETYLTDPETEPDPSKWITLITYPV